MMIQNILSCFKYVPAWLVYKCSSNSLAKDELRCWCNSLRIEKGSEFRNFCFLMSLREYRSELYWRLGSKARLIRKITPPIQLYTFQLPAKKLGRVWLLNTAIQQSFTLHQLVRTAMCGKM